MPHSQYIVFFFKKRKIMGVTTDDEFFMEIDRKHKQYIGFPKYDLLFKFLDELIGREDEDYFLKVWGSVNKLVHVNYGGYAYVNWDRYFALPKDELLEITFEAEKIADQRVPHIKKFFDERLALERKKRSQQNK